MGNFEQYAPGLAHLISMVARATNHYRYRSFGNEVLEMKFWLEVELAVICF